MAAGGIETDAVVGAGLVDELTCEVVAAVRTVTVVETGDGVVELSVPPLVDTGHKLRRQGTSRWFVGLASHLIWADDSTSLNIWVLATFSAS